MWRILIDLSIKPFKDLEFFHYDEVEYGIADDLNWFDDQDQVKIDFLNSLPIWLSLFYYVVVTLMNILLDASSNRRNI